MMPRFSFSQSIADTFRVHFRVLRNIAEIKHNKVSRCKYDGYCNPRVTRSCNPQVTISAVGGRAAIGASIPTPAGL